MNARVRACVKERETDRDGRIVLRRRCFGARSQRDSRTIMGFGCPTHRSVEFGGASSGSWRRRLCGERYGEPVLLLCLFLGPSSLCLSVLFIESDVLFTVG